MQKSDSHSPGVSELFYASVVASALVFLATLLAFSLLPLVISGDPVASLTILFIGGFYGILFAVTATFLLVAPLGTGLGLLVLRYFPPGVWQGPAVGGCVATILMGGFLALTQQTLPLYDGGNLVALAILILFSAIAGWIVQRLILRWPERV